MTAPTHAAPQYLFDGRGKKTEIRAVPGYPGYFVTEDGEVYSKVHSAKAWGKRLSPVPDKDGYPRLEMSIAGDRRKVSVHRLVALAFLGPQPADKPEIRHDDGNPAHNHYTNLAWSDRLDNMADRKRHGRNPVGIRNGRAILNEERVRAIKIRIANGDPASAIAVDNNVSVGAIESIASGKNWSHVA